MVVTAEEGCWHWWIEVRGAIAIPYNAQEGQSPTISKFSGSIPVALKLRNMP